MNNPEIFTPEERDENEERKRELIELVASGEAALIVGAGSSARVGYMTWNGLLEELEDLANRCGAGLDQTRKGDKLAYAEDIKSHIENKTGDLSRYYALLENLFSPKDPPFEDFHKTLISLPFRGILTTNYDIVLESALESVEHLPARDNSLVVGEDFGEQVDEFIRGMSDANIPRRIAHLHGIYDNPESIILSSEDYKNTYGFIVSKETPESKEYQKFSLLKPRSGDQVQRDYEPPLYQKLLWTVLASRRIVFVGFSLKDPYFNEMLDSVTSDLWRSGKSIHFSIMGISSEGAKNSIRNAKTLKEKYGIDTVFYEVIKGSHQGLDHIIDEVAELCGIKIKPTIDEADWLERTNQFMERGISDEN